jgi:3-methyl-2-oxobutanoate hydroxymethyltransferase
MALHTAAVRRGAPTLFLIGDLPFLSFRKGVPAALDAAAALMRAGAQSVKLEGVTGHEDVIEALVGSGIPVMGHLGLTPQSVNALSGFRVQGRREDDAMRIVEDARRLEALGCFSIVLECVPSALGARITQALTIPTIGVGAGIHCDGQVLVLQDLLGLTGGHRPKFVRTYLDGNAAVRDAIDRFDRDVKQGDFPAAVESYDA